MTALYVFAPCYLPDSFAVASTEFGKVVLAWLVPITHEEWHFIAEHSWVDFEHRLEELDPDLLDLNRPSIAAWAG